MKSLCFEFRQYQQPLTDGHWNEGLSLAQYNNADQLFDSSNNTNNVQDEQLPIDQLNNPFQFVLNNRNFVSNRSYGYTDNFVAINPIPHKPTNSNVATGTTVHQLNPEVPNDDNRKTITQLFSVPLAVDQLNFAVPNTDDRQNIVQKTPVSPSVSNSSASVSNNSTPEFFFGASCYRVSNITTSSPNVVISLEN